MLKKQSKTEQKSNSAKGIAPTVKRIWSYLAEQRSLLILVLLMVVASSSLGLLGPFLIGWGIDEYFATESTDGFIYLLVGLGVVYGLHSLTLWFQSYWMIGIAQKTVYTMRKQLFTHFHKLSIDFFNKRQHGELMSRVTNDIENVSATLNSSVIQIFSSVLTLVGTLAVMIWLSPLLTLVTMIIVPLMFMGMKWITSRTGRLYKEQQRRLGEMNGYIEETISGQKIIKSFSQEPKVIEEFRIKNKKLKESGYWAQTFTGFIPKLMNMLNNLSFTIVAAVGGYFAINGYVSIGTIVIFTEYSRQFTRPLNDLSNQFNTLLSAVAGADRVFDIIDTEEEAVDEKEAGPLQNINGKVEFKDVSFSYEKGGDTVSDLNFNAQPGQSVALVGPTGAGKSTIINLVSRFYEPDKGKILIDGVDSKKITRESLRTQMGFVLQDSFLFQGSIRENIRYGRLDATDEEVEHAAKAANAHTFIQRLPEGYDTVLSQDDAGISQGQKQLLSIARAILADPSILILDEATSSIDTITELKIQEALQHLLKGRTSFIIAHRLNTIKSADQIIVIEDGQIIEKGSHDGLLEQKGFYHSLYTSQLEKKMLMNY
ncbi:ABC transporter ATP-binding protein [Mesobacillus selenatarsenatis]|uniref:Lipid A export ATP-binding/permease protein MsbA n=1 Tax=Mesobacillus selenatarsenatis (strain DSM 18680 / JCM 14380 / FERM P-15431 / SF-1) TaxID=1321606 RepID=A0A0A8X8V1_MESS1|nr:ABC transporter ATP-binding protein [Mesobacillus selenatarsenatis]GAM16370.1 lipid A export ATP-binding/permease protein MsbA [Mesobacillus selenatarsenatis SF-1]